MLNVKVPGIPHSAYYTGPSTNKAGIFVKYAANATVALAPAGAAGGYQYARVGDMMVTPAVVADTLLGPVYPVKERHLSDMDSDLTLDTLTSGMYLTYFEGGEYETDNYGTITHSLFAPGKYLFLDASSLLTDVTGGAAVAIGIKDDNASFNSSYIATGMLWYRLLNFPVNPSGGTINVPTA